MFRGFWVDSLTFHHHLKVTTRRLLGRYNLPRYIQVALRSALQLDSEKNGPTNTARCCPLGTWMSQEVGKWLVSGL